MAETDITKDGQPGDAIPGSALNETDLRSEIAFWQDMIGFRSEALPPEAVERMHFALELARRRLAGLYEECPQPSAPNVYPLDPARRKAQ